MQNMNEEECNDLLCILEQNIYENREDENSWLMEKINNYERRNSKLVQENENKQ